jgi:cytochrome c oxidase subunit IV
MTGRVVWRCCAILLVLLAFTTAVAFVPLGNMTLFVSLAVAIAKALLVLVFFMELRSSSGLVRAFAAAGFVWLLIMFALTAADYTHRTDKSAPIDQVK